MRGQGQDDRVETLSLDHAWNGVAYTPWTEGAMQMVEVFSPQLPAPDAVRIIETAFALRDEINLFVRQKVELKSTVVSAAGDLIQLAQKALARKK